MKHDPACIATALKRFRKFCAFEPHTGCVVWIGGTTSGRGHNVPYGSFWFNGQRWFAHRWAAKFIHGLEIDGHQVDHKCPHIDMPNTLCVEHVWPLSLGDNRELQDVRRFEQRKLFVQLEVGLLTYKEIYGVAVDPADVIPFETFPRPAWLGPVTSPPPNADCPF
jgi:hypothetical protein